MNETEVIPQMERQPEEPEEEDRARLLPDDVLADVLSRLAPRGLATSRCVCTAWRAVIDGRGLLRADLLPPRSLAGRPLHPIRQRFSAGGTRGALLAPPVDGGRHQLPPASQALPRPLQRPPPPRRRAKPRDGAAGAAARVSASTGGDGVLHPRHVPRLRPRR
jgi:hypothetical protein